MPQDPARYKEKTILSKVVHWLSLTHLGTHTNTIEWNVITQIWLFGLLAWVPLKYLFSKFWLGIKTEEYPTVSGVHEHLCTKYPCKMASSTLFILKSKYQSTKEEKHWNIVVVWVKKCPAQAQVNTWFHLVAMKGEVWSWSPCWKTFITGNRHGHEIALPYV